MINKKIDSDTGISIRVLLSFGGLLVSVLITVVGVGFGAYLEIDDIHHDLESLHKEIRAQTELNRAQLDFRISVIEEEQKKRTPYVYSKNDRWTIENMQTWVYEMERLLNMTQVAPVVLPDPLLIKDRGN